MSSMHVPATDVEFRVIDYLALSAPAALVGAELVARFEGPDAGSYWAIQRVTVECSSSARTSAFLYAGDIAAHNLRDGTLTGNFDVADNFQAIIVTGPAPVVVRWVGASAGATATATIQAQLLGRYQRQITGPVF